ncbi:MAG: SDR family NAD(P)-dependent oxidoreductase [Beijerinckiaceae bacterium]|nr:SDR family NAD(P)-dependent oxidoreductase [Beijerinckiaceae bacterium]
MSQNLRTALIIGASRGLGLGLVTAYLAQGWRVIATRRGGATALEALSATAGDRLVIETLDVTDEAGIAALRERLAGETLDLLFVSAGVSTCKSATSADVAAEAFALEMATNALAPLRIIETFASLVAPSGVIVALSSALGSVSGNTSGGTEVYRASKAALNSLLRSFSARNRDRSLVALHPGWVRTDMGGSNAAIDIEQSVAGMVEVIAGRAGKPGCVYLDYRGKPIDW